VNTHADAIVITTGPDREALTEDYLTLAIRGDVRARGERFTALVKLEGDATVLT
jgi:uncharacterized protein with GYD domain